MLKKIFQRVSSPEQFPDVTGLLERHYQDQVAQQHIQHDDAQYSALQELQTLLEKLLSVYEYHQKPLAHKLVTTAPERCQGLYIYGDVGRGKSMLMSLFYETCPLSEKRRVHFNMFMLEAHAYIHAWRQQNKTDAITALAEKIRSSTFLLCLDEFHVSDIADAMILERLFRKLFDSGLIVVMTSNRHPDDLYLGGLQREQFLFFSKLLQRESRILELASKDDYRLIHLHALEATYYCPLDAHAAEFAQQSYNEFTNFATIEAGVLLVQGRKVVLSAVHGDVALTSFAELCEQALGSADYKEIAREFSTLIMAEIPKLTPEKRNEAKRFMTLVDALYEHKVKLICTAEVPAQELYTEGDGAFEFRRTASRLIEMQSESYLQSDHIRHG